MPLRRLEEIPVFVPNVDAYTLSQVKDEAGRYALQAYSELKAGQVWNNQITFEMNNALVDLQEARHASISGLKAFFMAIGVSVLSSFLGASIIYLMHLK